MRVRGVPFLKFNRPGVRSNARKPRSSAAPAAPVFRKTVLPNGIRVLTEKHPHSRAVSCGLWIEKGTRDEQSHEAGLAHFIEHMVFKRTSKRSAYKIARDMEAVGGDLNAYTSREYTCFVTHTLKDHVGLSLDVLSDLVCRPSFDPDDIKKEKQVVLQEIMMAEDQLDEFIFDEYFRLVYPEHPLGSPILGSAASIKKMPRQTILDFHHRLYTSENLIVSVAGNVEHDEVLELVLKHVKWPKGTGARRSPRSGVALKRTAPEFHSFRNVIRRPSEQVHILVGLPASSFCDDLRFDGFIVNSLLGGGMTSRLYQTVREDRGLVYSIHSQQTSFIDAGLNLIYAGTEPKKVPEVVELILAELKRLKKKGMSRKDLDLFKTQVKGQILLGADDIENRMNSLGVNEMVFGRYRSVDEVMKHVESVSFDSVHEYIDRYFDLDQLGVLLMGAMPEAPTKKWLDGL